MSCLAHLAPVNDRGSSVLPQPTYGSPENVTGGRVISVGRKLSASTTRAKAASIGGGVDTKDDNLNMAAGYESVREA